MIGKKAHPTSVESNDKIKSTRFSKLQNFLKKHGTAATLIAGILVIFLAGVATFFLMYQAPQYDNTMATHRKNQKFYSPLTGLQVPDENAAKAAVTGLMIENSPAARPQSGLKKAGVVYEAVAEGGITRFMALYQGSKPSLIGPVRSLRIYYLSWAAPYQASIGHVGGSGNALTEVRSGNYRDIDQFYNGGSYWRATDRSAPHNVYTSGEKIDQLNNSKNFTESTFTSFSRTDSKPVETPNATTISINFSSASYNTSYNYDKASNSYLRNLASTPHHDREEGQISPSVIVALEVATENRANNSDGYEDIKTTGSGKAYIFQNGTVTSATWSKSDLKSPLKLQDANGKDVPLNRGQTWIAAFTPGRGGIAWQ